MDMTSLTTLQDILNHSSEKMTLKYCGTEKEKREEMINDLSKLWQIIITLFYYF